MELWHPASCLSSPVWTYNKTVIRVMHGWCHAVNFQVGSMHFPFIQRIITVDFSRAISMFTRRRFSLRSKLFRRRSEVRCADECQRRRAHSLQVGAAPMLFGESVLRQVNNFEPRLRLALKSSCTTVVGPVGRRSAKCLDIFPLSTDLESNVAERAGCRDSRKIAWRNSETNIAHGPSSQRSPSIVIKRRGSHPWQASITRMPMCMPQPYPASDWYSGTSSASVSPSPVASYNQKIFVKPINL